MVIKRIIPIFLILSFFVNQSVVAGPGNRLFPWLVTSIITSVGSVGYMVGKSAQEAAPLITQQAVEQIAARAATQATEQAGQQGPGLVAQAASSGWQMAKAIAPSLLSKQGISIAAGLAAGSAALYFRRAIAANGKKIIENNRLIQSLRTYVEQQFTALNAAIQRLHGRHDQTQAGLQALQQQVTLIQQQVQTNGNDIQGLTAIAQANNSLLRELLNRIPTGWMGQLRSRFFGNTNPSEQE